MKRIAIPSLLLILSLGISACGGNSTPTVSAAEVQQTAVAAAFTMVAQTQQSIPSATPLPPTEAPTQTPLPTETPLPLPTLATQATTFTPAPVVANNTPGGDPCATRILSWSPKGKPTTIHIVNTTKAKITVSLYLNETASHSECGYRVYLLDRGNDVVINDLVQGCYSTWAFSDDPKVHVNASGYGCINNSDKWTIQISEGSIKGP